MKSLPTIAFDYRPSWSLAATIAAAFVLALVAIAACGLTVWVKLVLAVATLIYAAWMLRGFLRPPFDHVAWHSAGHWRLRSAGTEQRPGKFIAATVIGPLISLTLRVEPKRTVTLLLLPDNCDRETRRRLRVRLARGTAQA